jgi:hypothetical protein
VSQSSPAPTGGAANFAGVLYQILQTLKTVAYYTLERVQKDVVLIAEPHGGDLQEQTLTTRTVSQFKTTTEETWSLKTVVGKVLPDLYLAVDLSKPSRYRFVSNARIGTWAGAYEFFRKLHDREATTGDELLALDATVKRKFAKGYQATERELFLEVVQSVRSHGDAPEETKSQTITKVWHLLSSFEMPELASQEDAEREIERLMRELGVAPDDVAEKRAALIGFLAMRSAPGNGRFEPHELLGQAKLSGIPLSARERSAEIARQLFQDDIARAGYTSAVRIDRGFALPPPDPRRITSFSGPSGYGKSWGMMEAAERVAGEYDHPVVYVRATGDAAGDFGQAAGKISREVLGRSESNSLRELALDVNDLLPDDNKPWLTVCVDNVQSMAEAEGLLANDREFDRVRVLFTATAEVGQALRNRRDVAVVDVDTFTRTELERYLDQHGWDWSEVPTDIRQLIRQPLLARLFVELAGDSEWKGTNEYALFAAYWERLTSGLQTDYPQDPVILRELALETAMERVGYPWSAKTLRNAGIDDEVRRRLERTGWLRREADAGASIWHDRLLNWAVAEALAGNVRSGAMTLDQFASALVGCAPRFGRTRYGYVPMDALWLASAEGELSTEDQVRVLRKLEGKDVIHFDSLYGRDLVTTLGARILPALIMRVEQMDSDHRHEASILAAALFRTVGRELFSDQLAAFLAHQHVRVQEVALRYVRKSPRRELLDQIWEIHVGRQSSADSRLRRVDYEITYAALATGCRHSPEWLRRRISESTTESARIWDLAFLLAGLGNDEGNVIWRDTKNHLFAILPQSHARGVVRCVDVYKDREEIERLTGWLEEEQDALGSAAFSALVTIDPERAVASIERLRARELGLTRSWWMPWLMLKLPEATQEKLRRRLLAAPEDLWDAAQYFSDFEELIDPETLETLLQMLMALIPRYLTQAPGTRHGRPDVILRVIARCTYAPQLRVLESHRGDASEKQLTELAIHWLKNDRHDSELKYLRVVLQRIGGDGYVELARESLRRLGPDDYSSDLDVAEPCVPDITPELQDVADRFIDADPQSQAHTLAFYALRLLASVGDRGRLITAALKRAGNIEIDVPHLLTGHPATDDESFAKLLGRFEHSAGDEQERATYALGMTGRADAIPHLRRASNDATDSETRNAAHYAIDALINEGITADLSIISSSVEPITRFRALLQIGTTDALDELERELLSINSDEPDLLDFGAVLLDPIRGPRVGDWMWRNMQAHNVRFWHARWWNALRYARGGRDVLNEYATDGPLSIRRFATAALAAVDSNATSSMIERAMRSYVTDHDDLAEIYLRGDDPKRATAFLRNHMTAEINESCRMAIGRAFRRYPSAIAPMLPEMFSAPDAETRRCACDIAGWLQSAPYRTELMVLAFDDLAMHVRQAAIDALQRQEEFLAAEELHRELIAALGIRAFTYADALAETADPIVLSRNDDPLCIWPAMAGRPRLLSLHMEEKLEKCAKAVEKRAEEKTGDRQRAVD